MCWSFVAINTDLAGKLAEHLVRGLVVRHLVTSLLCVGTPSTVFVVSTGLTMVLRACDSIKYYSFFTSIIKV